MVSVKRFLQALATEKFWKEFVIMTVGMLIASASVYYFLVPSSLVIGNISGLAIVLSKVLSAIGINISIANMVLAVNVILLIMAFVLLGRDFGAKTVYTSLVLGPMITLWEKICPYTSLLEEGQVSVMGDIWFDLLGFVILVAASQAIMFSINASTGGLDILAKILNKYFHMDIGTCVSVAGIVTCLFAFAIHPFRMVVIGIIGTWINGLALDYFASSISRRKRVCIVSDRYEEIRQYIIHHIVRGCSLYEVTGGYSLKKSMEVQSLLTNEEFAALMQFIKANDIQAFITAGNVSEVYGLWSNSKKLRKERKITENK